ncbi:MAG: response regulator transcription factor [Peptococcaceae bacterium]|jgi:DNA-binding response OmpR family regulator|nr:response regulator transcription factor [Peptococcaceae bacterium]
MHRILIIEDDKVIREELKSLLEKYLYTVITTEDFSDVVRFALASNPHLILLDLNLPFYDGYHICRELRRQSSVPIIVVTSRDSEMDELMSMRLGADYFVAKPYNTQILIAKIAALLGRAYGQEASGLRHFGELTLDMGKSAVSREGKGADLTKNESRILQILMESKGKIVSRDDIMNALWQSDAFVDDNTLTVNINRLRKKLAEIGGNGLLKTKRGQGYSL